MKDNTVREELINDLMRIPWISGYSVEGIADFILANYIPKSAIEPLKKNFVRDSVKECAFAMEMAIQQTLTNCGEKI